MIRRIEYWLQRRIRGWDDRETWALNYEFIVWLNTRTKKYLELADKIIDLDYHIFTYKGFRYSQRYIITKIIELTDEYLKICEKDMFDERLENIVKTTFDLFHLVYWAMWW